MKISMLSALSVWGKSTRFVGSWAGASTAISSRSKRFALGSPSLKARGDRVSIWPRHVRRIHPFLSPDHEAIASVSQARFGVSSERADKTSSLGSGEVESAVNTVATRFREAKRYEAAFVRFLPRRAQESGTSATRSRPGPFPFRREAQRESVASRVPPRRDWGAARRASQSASKRPDLRSIISSKKRS